MTTPATVQNDRYAIDWHLREFGDRSARAAVLGTPQDTPAAREPQRAPSPGYALPTPEVA